MLVRVLSLQSADLQCVNSSQSFGTGEGGEESTSAKQEFFIVIKQFCVCKQTTGEIEIIWTCQSHADTTVNHQY